MKPTNEPHTADTLTDILGQFIVENGKEHRSHTAAVSAAKGDPEELAKLAATMTPKQYKAAASSAAHPLNTAAVHAAKGDPDELAKLKLTMTPEQFEAAIEKYSKSVSFEVFVLWFRPKQPKDTVRRDTISWINDFRALLSAPKHGNKE